MVREALAAEKALRKLTGPSFKWCRMSASEFEAAALKNAGRTRQEAAALWEEVSRRQDVPTVKSFIGNVFENFAGKMHGGPDASCHEPPKENLRGFAPRTIDGPNMTGVLVECGLLPGRPSVLDLVAAAAVEAVRVAPDSFGFSESKKAEQRALGAKRDELAKEISEAWTPEDLDFVEIPNSNGLCKVAFKCSGGAVTINPKADCGARLIRHLADRPELARAYLG